MSNRPGDLEHRVGGALHAEVDGIAPDPDSLTAIRERGRAARRRRSLATAGAVAVVAVAVAVAVPAIRDDTSNVTTRPDPGPTTTSAPPPPPQDLIRPLWPDPEASEQYDDPEAAARGFLTAVLGIEDPPLSAVRDTGDGRAEVDVFDRSEGGAPLSTVASTLSVARLDGERWYLIGAASDDVRIETPEQPAMATTPLTVTGEGRGYEGTIVVEVRARAADAPVLAEAPTIAGAGEALAPFSVELTLPEPRTAVATGMLIARTDPGIDPGVPHLAAQPIVLSGTTPAPGTGARIVGIETQSSRSSPRTGSGRGVHDVAATPSSQDRGGSPSRCAAGPAS